MKLNTLPKRFRAWHTIQEKMYSPEQLAEDQLTLLATGKFINVSSVSTQMSVILESMIPLQTIGTTDKNGSEIFEGDIILWNGFHWIISWSVRQNRHFFESTNSFLLRDESGKVWGEWGFLTSTIKVAVEVVGNIFENPELVIEQDYSYNRFDKPEP